MGVQKMKLANKIAIVTGGNRGIGKAICLGLAKEGANIAVVAGHNLEPPKSELWVGKLWQ
jgi:NAD(P)-dependent dehydrogenase (short-subunit alcohol dehydrogenase family)